jgi:hypothetical protein
VLTDESTEITVHGMSMDCSALGEEAASRDGVGCLEGEEVWLRVSLPVGCKLAPDSA